MLTESDYFGLREEIYSARFDENGRRAYIVTFDKTDPFFVFDLQPNRKPYILGQFKVPGFSSYLHPYDDKTLIGLGRITTFNGSLLGIKVSLIDYSDPTRPKEIKSYSNNDSSFTSIAEFEHRAFQFDSERHIMVIPGVISSAVYRGPFIFKVRRDYANAANSEVDLVNLVQNRSGPVQRCLIIGNYIFCKARCLMTVINISNRVGTTEKEIVVPC